jgi:hypothetical protein
MGMRRYSIPIIMMLYSSDWIRFFAFVLVFGMYCCLSWVAIKFFFTALAGKNETFNGWIKFVPIEEKLGRPLTDRERRWGVRRSDAALVAWRKKRDNELEKKLGRPPTIYEKIFGIKKSQCATRIQEKLWIAKRSRGATRIQTR